MHIFGEYSYTDGGEKLLRNNKKALAPNIGRILLIVGLLLVQASISTGIAQTIPNVNQPAPGTLISGPIDPDMGRLSTIEYLGGYVITIPENPGSEPGDHMTVKAWRLSDLSNP